MNVRAAVRPPRPDLIQEPPQHPAPALVAPLPPAERPEPKVYPPKIAKAILAIMRDIGAVQKAGWNDFHKYNYQKWDDILDKVSVLQARHGLIIVPSEVSRSLVENDQQKNDQLVGITYEFSIINEDGEVWPDRPRMTAFGRVRDSKNVCDDKAATKCHTQAEKYFLIHLFKIRTGDMPDSDADGSDVRKEAPDRPKPPRPQGASPRKPCAISTTGTTFQKWSEEYSNAIKQAVTVEDVKQWRGLNSAPLSLIEEKAAGLHEQIAKVEAERLNDLAARETPTPPAPAKSNGAPSPADSMPKWLEWLDAELGTFQEGDGEKLETFWNDKVAPLTDEFLPMDQEAALGLYRKHEFRIAP